MTTELETRPILELPGGIIVTLTGATVLDTATDREVEEEFGRAAKLQKSAAWVLGDLAIAAQERKRRKLAVEAVQLRDRANSCDDTSEGIKTARDLRERAEKIETLGVVEYTSDLCTRYDVDAGTLKNNVMLCRFYEPSSRNDGLKVEHHKVALIGAGGAGAGEKGIKKAQAWLHEAAEEKLTAGELRKRVAMSLATAPKVKCAPVKLAYAELLAADKWCIAHLQDEIDSEIAASLVVSLDALIQFVDKVRRAAGLAVGNQRGQ
jgi:hypothetical protein